VSWLNIAFRLMQLPLGIFGVAVATVTLPLISRSAAVGNTAEFRGALSHAIRLVMLLTIPSAIGLIILANPIISLIYEHGRFTAFATDQTALALRWYAVGLVAYSADKVLAPAFYALDKRHLPMFVSLCSIAINFCLNYFFTFHLKLGHRGLALSTSLVAFSNFMMLYTMMRRYAGRLETGALIRTLAKLLVAGALLAVICLLAQHFIFFSHAGTSVWRKLFGLLLTIAVGGATFFGAAYLLHVAELRDVVALVRGRLSRLRS
jgi:putative peptidoglycan lipid II flippase